MAEWTTALADLRTFLCDTDRDNLVKDKEVFGPRNGQNRTFFTFDDRLVASGVQSSCDRPLRVFLNSVEIAASGIVVTDQYRGEFQVTMGATPSGNVKLTSSYYHQQFTDGELNLFLTQAQGLTNSSSLEDVPAGMQPAVLDLAGAFAHQRLAQRWMQRKSEQFMLQEKPGDMSEVQAKIAHHRETAQWMRKEGLEIRRSYYDLRHDRGRSPAFGLINRKPPNYGPSR